MPVVTLYRLRPRGPMRFGRAGIEVEEAVPFPSAATMFSAWCWAIRDLAGNEALERFLTGFRLGDPPLLLAAPLPWIGRVLLLPRPWLPMPMAPEAADAAPPDKRGKRYRWVEESLWFRLLAGQAPAAAFADVAAFHQGQTIWAAGEPGAFLEERRSEIVVRAAPGAADAGAFWRVAALPHVTVDRRTRAGGIFHRGATWFAEGVDLALPVIWRDEHTRPLAERALAELGESGIGGERSAGYGQFEMVEHESRVWPDLTSDPAFVTLAGYYPSAGEAHGGVFAPPAAYQIEMSRGWVERTGLRHGVRLVAPGSVLRRLAGRSLYGELVDVTPPSLRAHRAYRYGYAFPLPVAARAGREEP